MTNDKANNKASSTCSLWAWELFVYAGVSSLFYGGVSMWALFYGAVSMWALCFTALWACELFVLQRCEHVSSLFYGAVSMWALCFTALWACELFFVSGVWRPDPFWAPGLGPSSLAAKGFRSVQPNLSRRPAALVSRTHILHIWATGIHLGDSIRHI